MLPVLGRRRPGLLRRHEFRRQLQDYIWKLTPDGKDLVESSRTQINEGAHREANKLLKINGTYYHFFSEVKDGARVVMMQRSKNVMGPYTERRQLTAANSEWHEPNQGGIVDTKDGQWFFVTHHGGGDWEGRPMTLLPVTWIDGWPICGKTDAAGAPGLMVWSGKKPLAGPKVTPQSSDDFVSPQLGQQWEWNYQPRADKWSLTKRPGFLRLEAFRPLRPDDLMTAGNTLTQRSFRTPKNLAMVKLDLTGLADGQKTGLCHFARSHSALGGRAGGQCPPPRVPREWQDHCRSRDQGQQPLDPLDMGNSTAAVATPTAPTGELHGLRPRVSALVGLLPRRPHRHLQLQHESRRRLRGRGFPSATTTAATRRARRRDSPDARAASGIWSFEIRRRNHTAKRSRVSAFLG